MVSRLAWDQELCEFDSRLPDYSRVAQLVEAHAC